ncbi:hypothetical protein F2Q68_00005242 [Brassica cretica]|uniref:Ubiquitin-like protease family profile domain-containing protein n=1 Tax=Brassica cretica TaxID=69181 RepID=A0A8S9J6Z6_BRACR|nr:hypothetical protein F2Q68_00005242 [Brassica cretica]
MAPDACTAKPRAPHVLQHGQDTCRTPPLLPDVRRHDWNSCKAPHHLTHVEHHALVACAETPRAWSIHLVLLHVRMHVLLLCTATPRASVDTQLSGQWKPRSEHSHQATPCFSVHSSDFGTLWQETETNQLRLVAARVSLRMAPDACTAKPRAPQVLQHGQDTCRTPPLLPDVRRHDWNSCKATHHLTHVEHHALVACAETPHAWSIHLVLLHIRMHVLLPCTATPRASVDTQLSGQRKPRSEHSHQATSCFSVHSSDFDSIITLTPFCAIARELVVCVLVVCRNVVAARHVTLPDPGVGLDGQSCSCLIVGWPVGLSSPTLGVGRPSVMFLFDCWPVVRPMLRTNVVSTVQQAECLQKLEVSPCMEAVLAASHVDARVIQPDIWEDWWRPACILAMLKDMWSTRCRRACIRSHAKRHTGCHQPEADWLLSPTNTPPSQLISSHPDLSKLSNHWISICVNFIEKKVEVFDCQRGRNRQYVEKFAAMIPRIVKAVAPPENKKQLLLSPYFIIDVPMKSRLNKSCADCGVYALKHLECLLLGLDLSLVDDEIMHGCRQKIALYIREAAHDPMLIQLMAEHVPSEYETSDFFNIEEG